MSFEVDTLYYKALRDAVEEAGRELGKFPKGEMGLTPDAVKATPEWKNAKKAYDHAFAVCREFAGKYCKKYKKELRDMRRTRTH